MNHMKPTRKTIYCCLKIILLQINLYLLLFQIKHALLLLPAGIIAYWILNDKEFESRLSFWYLLIVPILAMVSIRQFIIPSLLLSALLIVLTWPLEQKEIIPTISVVFLVGGAVLFSVFRFGKIIFQISPIMLYVVAAFLTIPILFYVIFFLTRFFPVFFTIRVYLRKATRLLISIGLVCLTLIPFLYLIMIRGFVSLSLDDFLAFALLCKIFMYLAESDDYAINKGYTGFTQYEPNERSMLFLRKFSYALNEDASLLSISKYFSRKYPALRYNTIAIADPKLLYCYGQYACNFIFLPTVNWKKHVREYIKSATLVVAILDSSEGVFWEVFDNADYRYKYIYYLPSKEILTKIIVDPKFNEYENEPLGKFLRELFNIGQSYSIDFPLYIHWDGSSFGEDVNVANILETKIQNGDLS